MYYNGKTYFGTIGSDGHVYVKEYVHSTGALSASVDLKTLSGDDHANPSFLIRDSDKKIMAFYSNHTGSDVFVRISTNAEDATAWESEVGLDATLSLSSYTYTNPVQLLGETDDPIYLIFRANDGGGLQYHYTKSTDGGATWASSVKIWNQIRPYSKFAINGNDRIDFAVCTTHPDTAVNDLYHCYYQGGSWYQTDGTLITAAPPFDVSSGSIIWDASENSDVRCWVWDIATDSNGYPVIVYATFNDAATDHRYRYARWNGTSWNDYPLCNGGAALYVAETYYSGGVYLDHANPNIVYAAREVDGNPYQIYKYTTADGGTTFTSEQMTDRSTECLRPFVVWGATDNPKLMYFTGTYTTFTDYQTITILEDG